MINMSTGGRRMTTLIMAQNTPALIRLLLTALVTEALNV